MLDSAGLRENPVSSRAPPWEKTSRVNGQAALHRVTVLHRAGRGGCRPDFGHRRHGPDKPVRRGDIARDYAAAERCCRFEQLADGGFCWCQFRRRRRFGPLDHFSGAVTRTVGVRRLVRAGHSGTLEQRAGLATVLAVGSFGIGAAFDRDDAIVLALAREGWGSTCRVPASAPERAIQDCLLFRCQRLVQGLDRRLCRLQPLEPRREELLHPVHPVEHRRLRAGP
jgi:hypothetical protein